MTIGKLEGVWKVLKTKVIQKVKDKSINLRPKNIMV